LDYDMNGMEVWLNQPLQATASAGVQNVPILAGTIPTHNLTCSYAGDAHFAASTSAPVAVAVPAETLAVTSTSTSQIVTAGQTATYALTVTPGGGYGGTVKLSCGALPTETTCSFSPASVGMSSGAGQTTLSIATTAAITSRNEVPPSPFGWELGGTALAGLLGLGLAPRRLRRVNRRLRALACIALLAALGVGFIGCGGGSTTQSNPGTPAGTYTVTVTAADSTGTPTNSLNVTLVVQ
jgi:hypothetical protein